MEINRVMLLGNLTQDPETRYLQSGTAVSRLRLASNRRFKTGAGEQREETLFINVDVWGRQAETCRDYLRKGSEVLIEGRLRMNTYTTQDGQNRSEIQITAERVQFGRRPGGAGAVDDGGDRSFSGAESESGSAPPPPRAQSRPPARHNASPGWGQDTPPDEAPPSDFPASGGTDNDLPF